MLKLVSRVLAFVLAKNRVPPSKMPLKKIVGCDAMMTSLILFMTPEVVINRVKFDAHTSSSFRGA